MVMILVIFGVIVAPAAAAATVYFHDVDSKNVVKPKTLFLTGDGTLEVQSVSWSGWGGSDATGSGKAEYHGCTPSCAQAKVHHAQVKITLSKIKTCSGKQYYTHVALKLPSGKLLDGNFLKRSWSPC
jgi:hypothetical protein